MIKQKNLFERKLLLEKLSNIIKEIDKKELLAIIKSIYVFGSILHEKRYIGDIDLIVVYEFSPIQKLYWKRFKNYFVKQIRPLLLKKLDLIKKKYSKVLNQYRTDLKIQGLDERDIQLKISKKRKKLSIPHLNTFMLDDLEIREILKNQKFPIEWFCSFTWKMVTKSNYSPKISELIKHILFGKDLEYFHAYIVKQDKFSKGYIPTIYDLKVNYILAWDSSNPDPFRNIDNRSPTAKYDHITREIDDFITDIRAYSMKNPLKNLIIREGNETYNDLIIKLYKTQAILKNLKKNYFSKKREL